MKRSILTIGLSVLFIAGSAQSAESYFVKTKGVKKAAPTVTEDTVQKGNGEEEEAKDFVGKNFKFLSLCDWTEGMRFMVLPEKYDLIVKTFSDAEENKEVSSMTLRHKIMVYKGHSVSPEGRAHVDFVCEETGKKYYYEIPNGSFDDYCYNKMGVPTLAYLGDVDTARVLLMGKKLLTKTTVYREDTEADGEGFREVKVDLNQEVTVKGVGVGSRSFPVKIIVEDAKGNQFYQNVAISKINSGMRDDEFVMDLVRNTFYGSFAIADEVTAVSTDYAQYVGQTIYSKFATDMITKGDGRERTMRVPKLTTFTIERIVPLPDGEYVTLSLLETETRREYAKNVTFINVEEARGTFQAKAEDYFGYVFGLGEGISRNTSQAARAAIRAGRVIVGMTEDEVMLAVGEPDQTAADNTGQMEWIYKRSNGKLLIVHFGRNGLVQSYRTAQGSSNNTLIKSKSTRRSSSSSSNWQSRPGTPIMN